MVELNERDHRRLRSGRCRRARPICAETGASRTIAVSSGLAACFCMVQSVSAGELGSLKSTSLIVVSLLGRRDIKVPERDLLAMSGRQIEQIRAHDRVCCPLLLVAILETRNRVWLTGHREGAGSGAASALISGAGSGLGTATLESCPS